MREYEKIPEQLYRSVLDKRKSKGASRLALHYPAFGTASPFRYVLEKFTLHRWLIPLIPLIVISMAFDYVNPGFLSVLNVGNMLPYIAELGIIAFPVTLLMTAGEFDLSDGAVFGFCPLVLFILYNDHVMSFELAFILVLGIAASIGLANGLLVTKLKIPSFLTTLGTMTVFEGVALYVSHGFAQTTFLTQSIIKPLLVGTFQVGKVTVYAAMIWFVALICLTYFVLNETRFGNWISATGGNLQAARGRGIPTDRVKITLFVLVATLSAFSGVMDSIRVSSAWPTAGEGYELEVIAMSVIGGTSLFGGTGSIIGTLLGVILLRFISNGVILAGMPGLSYNIFVGLAILIMMTIYVLIERRIKRES
ncbi:MAG TPA: ABC transporter permease [Candidatus Dormibacteraeota bacterium]|nr:ABC transporter permease [Candidatus Dormibacteraeota bacterium]